jgi:tetratricopeptide (TPR) repeat protein
MLPATFVLLGLIAYVHGRRLAVHRPRAGLVWMVAGIGAGTLLAVLCKANGALLPLLAWVLEATVLRGAFPAPAAGGGRRVDRVRTALLALPSLAVFIYLLSPLPQWNATLDHRPWTIGERLLTEPRVLLDYLQLLLVPRVLSTGLYNDGYLASTSLLQPASTLPALLLIGALAALAFILRRRAPFVAGALLFFFAGHLLESTTIPLELYFEHRNYLPAMLLFWPVARMLCAGSRHAALRLAGALLLLGACAATTWQRAELWGKPEQMARLWALQNPASSRAQVTAASYEVRAGQPHMALRRLGPLLRERPHDLQLALNYANAACAAGGLAPRDIDAVEAALRGATSGDALVFRWLDRALNAAAAGRCPGLDLPAVERLIDAAWRNPRLQAAAGPRQDLHSLAGRVALQRGQATEALAHFDLALAAYPTPTAAAMQAALLATDGHYQEALALLDRYEALAHARPAAGPGMPRLHRWVLDRQDYWPRELALLRAKLRAEIAKAGSASSTGAPGA